jgi:hypothetical protein
MRISGKLVSQLTEADLLQLVADGRAEDQNLDFKAQGYSGGNAGAELSKDVIGMANTAGGVLLIGVEEKGERAVGIPGIALENGDRDPMERYERMLRDRIEPPIQGIQIKAIPVGKEGKKVIAIGVPTSMSRPHRTKVSGEGSGRGRWAIRRNKNTDDMTYREIRGAFLDLADIEARVRQFHAARIDEVFQYIQTNDLGARMGVMLLHVVPLASDGVTFNVRNALNQKGFFWPPGQSSAAATPRPDLDGLEARLNISRQLGFGWAKLYRDGRMEGVVSGYVRSEPFEGDTRLAFQFHQFVREAHRAVCAYIELLTNLGFNPPFVVALSLLNAKGCNLFRPDAFSPQPLTSTTATFGPVMIETVGQSGTFSYYAVMKPQFDQLWNAFGLMECDLYDKNGRLNG